MEAMGTFLLGLILFFGLHCVTATPSVRGLVVARVGESPWKGIVTLGSLAGIALVVTGWSSVPGLILFAPSPLAIHLAPVLVSVALVLIVIGGGKLAGNIRRRLHHPMLVGTILWSATHLLANGGLRETLLFGAFLAFAVYALFALLRAGKRATYAPAWKWDAIGVAVGLFVAVGVMHGHKALFGVAVV